MSAENRGKRQTAKRIMLFIALLSVAALFDAPNALSVLELLLTPAVLLVGSLFGLDSVGKQMIPAWKGGQ